MSKESPKSILPEGAKLLEDKKHFHRKDETYGGKKKKITKS